MFITNKGRVWNNNLIFRIDQYHECQCQCTGDPRCNHDAPGVYASFLLKTFDQCIAEFRYPLRYGIFIRTVIDSLNGLCFDLPRNVKIRLTYAQVHRILHFLRKVKDLSDPRGVQLRHPVGNHYFFAFSFPAAGAAAGVAAAAAGVASAAASAFAAFFSDFAFRFILIDFTFGIPKTDIVGSHLPSSLSILIRSILVNTFLGLTNLPFILKLLSILISPPKFYLIRMG